MSRRQPPIRIRLFGTITVEVGSRRLEARDFGGVKPKQILELLLVARGHPVPKDRLADAIWGDRLPRDFEGALETYVSILRRRLGATGSGGRDLVVTEPRAYRFAVDRAEIDLDRFDALLARAGEGDASTRRRCLEDALALVRGDLLEDEPYAEWAEELRQRYRELVIQALLEAADAALAERDFPGALAHAERALAIDPHGESAYQTAMIALCGVGRREHAIRTFDRCRAALEQLGLEPGPETLALHAAIERHAERAWLPPANAVNVNGALPLLARTRELRMLGGLVRTALAGSFVLALVEGEAGMGKSRLLAETVARIRGARVGWGRCSALESDLPYVPLAAALRDALADVELDREAVPELGEILPELALPRRPRGLAKVSALEGLVRLVRRHAPLVLVLDDLQWADAASIAALAYLERRCADRPLAVLGAFRPGDAPPEHALWRLDPAARLVLEPLSPQDLVPLGSSDLYQRTGGIPLFVALAATARGDRRVPTALAEQIVARCRAEGPYAYRALVTASVLDQPFEPSLLAAVLSEDVAGLTEELERLCERRLLAVEGAGFAFRFPVMREVLAAMLSPARHRLVGEHVVALQPAQGLTVVPVLRPGRRGTRRG